MQFKGRVLHTLKKWKKKEEQSEWNVAHAEGKKKLYPTSRTELQTHIFNKTDNKQACNKLKINTCQVTHSYNYYVRIKTAKETL